jgi:ABC-type sugar transport system ATPase subunit
MATVSIKDVRKTYDRTDIIKGVTVDVADGEFLVLVGPSGCGKSTLLRMVAGLEEISAGSIAIDGRVVNDVKPADRDIAMVFQSYALYPHLTVYENMAFGLRLRKLPAAEVERLVAQAASVMELEALLQRFPRELSGGQRQRVAIGRAIVRNPRVFLFDEPLSNLDAALRGRMRIELKKLHRRLAATMLYVTHDQVEAMTLADRIVVLNHGVIQQAGTPRELYENPRNRFVAGFIGTPQMNFLEGRLQRVDGALTFRLSDDVALPVDTSILRSPLDQARDAILGLRPADLNVASDGPGALVGELDVVEPLGWESLLHLTVEGQELVVQAETARARELDLGARVPVAIDPRRLHLFERESGERL